MSGSVDPSVLQSMVGTKAVKMTEVPVTASRAMRLAMTRAAEQAIGLQITVVNVGEETLSLEGVQKALNDDLLLLKLLLDHEAVGVLALDRSLISAIVEVQTTGQIGSVAPEERPATLADLMMTQPLLDRLFGQLLETTLRTVLDGWTAGVVHGERFDDVRAIGLVLDHVTYRVMRLTIDLGNGDRKGELSLILPSGDIALTQEPVAKDQADWSHELRETVMESPAALTAVLHRFDVPLRLANDLQVGQVLPLPGCTVNSVVLVGPDGTRVARAKLGQVAGHVAVRLEDPMVPQMASLKTPTIASESDQMALAEESASAV